MARKKKLKCALLEKHKMSEAEKEYYDKIFENEKQKYERDKLAGGVSENGYYVRLHDRGDG